MTFLDDCVWEEEGHVSSSSFETLPRRKRRSKGSSALDMPAWHEEYSEPSVRPKTSIYELLATIGYFVAFVILVASAVNGIVYRSGQWSVAFSFAAAMMLFLGVGRIIEIRTR